VGDPDYAELVPTFTASTTPTSTDASVTLPDSGLKPYFVNNYDLSIEYYFAKDGVLGGSLFRKEISGFIINRVAPLTDPQVADVLAQYGITQADFGLTTPQATIRQNGSRASVQGIELWYNQNLTFLPKPFDGLNFQTNFTRTDTNSQDLDTLYAAQADAVSKQINVRLAYRWRKVQVAFGTNWTGEVLTGIASGPTITVTNPDGSKKAYGILNQYKKPEIKSKFEASYSFSRAYTATFEIDNIGYQRQEEFKNYQPMQTQVHLAATRYIYGDPVLRLGVKGAF
jgi:iron complex outermembrane receptor protein